MENQAVSWKKVFIIAGAFCAFWIGSGVATGQEALQYAASNGAFKGIATTTLYSLFLIFMVYILYGVGQREQFDNPYDVFEYYCGKYVGQIYIWFSVVLTYGIYVVMLAGSGAAIHQYYGISANIGTYFVAILALATAVLGIEKLLDIIGVIGPVKILFLSIIGIAALGTLAENPGILAVNSELIQSAGFESVSSNWIWSAILWALLGLIFGIAFFIINGQTCQSVKEARIASILGVCGVFVVNTLLIISEVVYLDTIRDQQVPTLAIAKLVAPFLAMIFAPVLILCIYSAVASLLLVVTRKFAVDKTKKFNLAAIGLTVVGMFAGTLLPFAKLVNIMYPLSGYAAIALMGFIIYKEFINKNAFPYKASGGASVQNNAK